LGISSHPPGEFSLTSAGTKNPGQVRVPTGFYDGEKPPTMKAPTEKGWGDSGKESRTLAQFPLCWSVTLNVANLSFPECSVSELISTTVGQKVQRKTGTKRGTDGEQRKHWEQN
jgi:hypothetical protein